LTRGILGLLFDYFLEINTRKLACWSKH